MFLTWVFSKSILYREESKGVPVVTAVFTSLRRPRRGRTLLQRRNVYLCWKERNSTDVEDMIIVELAIQETLFSYVLTASQKME